MQLVSTNTLFMEKKVDMSTILVVEDEPNVRKFVTVNLVKRGYNVLEAENGRQALKHLYSQKTNLMILDIKLPDISGWDILEEFTSIQNLSSDSHVLIMTASAVDQGIVFKQYPCVVEILVKPFNIDKLIKSVNGALTHT